MLVALVTSLVTHFQYGAVVPESHVERPYSHAPKQAAYWLWQLYSLFSFTRWQHCATLVNMRTALDWFCY